MHNLESLMGMILGDALERGGKPEVHHADESKNTSQGSCPEQRPYPGEHRENLPTIRYKLELIKRPNGTLYWAE